MFTRQWTTSFRLLIITTRTNLIRRSGEIRVLILPPRAPLISGVYPGSVAIREVVPEARIKQQELKVTSESNCLLTTKTWSQLAESTLISAMALLASYGLTDPISSAAAALMPAECQLGRIITSVRDHYRIITENGELLAQPTGRFLFIAEDSADLPVTGDWVVIKVVDNQALIIDLIPRCTSLVRKSVGRDSAQQIVAANVDTAFIVQSLDRDFNLRRLERYLVMAYDGRVEPVVLLSKQDLLTAQAVQSLVTEAETVAQGVPVLAYSALDSSGLDIISALIQPRQSFCLVGSSGVGKSTLINRLLGESRLETQAVREKDSRGRHTTARRELILLDSGGILIDTPGMRELGVMAAQSSLVTTFPEIEALADKCHYRGCRHQQEPGCAVREAVEDGDLPPSRYESFLALSREVGYNASQSDQLSRQKRKRARKQISKLSKTIKEWKPRF